jgi:hypothetical protein
VVAAGATLAAYRLAVRPWHRHWGATDEEVRRVWPGDELVPDPAFESTRAITIDAPAEAVWPWLVQIGQGRGGFYSYAWLENLVGAAIHNADRIVPAWQTLHVGDTVRMAPPERFGGQGRAIVMVLELGRALVLGPATDSPEAWQVARKTGAGTWAFILDPIDAQTTRLIVRTRSHAWEAPWIVFNLYDSAHFIMERKMMLGIKQRTERASQVAEVPA